MSDEAGSSSGAEKAENPPQNTENLDESSVNLCDILKEQEEKEAEALAVLGGSDESSCTFSKGYIKRQAIYSCMTCVPESKENAEKRAGICLACSLSCHESHDLIELYTKRNFKCDCGGGKMSGIRCLLEPIKFGESSENKYNQNFSGLYCVCHRPYPDPEDQIVDEMIQCISCEDWYHGRHLNTQVPPNCEDYSEMVCGQCMDSLPFLRCYLDFSVNKQSPVDVETAEKPAKRQKLDSDVCKKGNLDMDSLKEGSAVFWVDEWRSKLCRCEECMEMYKSLKVEYLVDPEDTVQKYEEAGRKRCAKAEDPIDKAISSLGRVQQIDLLTQYNSFKDRLKEFLHAFATNQQVVTEDDINRFFAMMKNEKKEAQGLPYFCR